jgi:hypothetical protein
MKRLGYGLVLGVVLSGCAPVTAGGPPVALAPEFVDGARVDTIFMSSEWLRSEPDFEETFTEEVREELNLCARGPRRLDMRVHLEDLRRGERLDVILRGRTEHQLSGVVEFVDPRSRAVVGRYPISVAAGTDNPLVAAVADRQMVVSEAFGRELCRQAFGRNPRGHPLTRSTDG